MKYQEISKYDGYWMFEDKDIPVSESDKKLIRPLTYESGTEIWNRYIGENNRHPMLLDKADWATNEEIWSSDGTWHDEWNSDIPGIPRSLEASVNWADGEVVYFMYCRGSVIETTWAVFKRNWKCFLFEDEGPFLISKTGSEVIWFGPNGRYKVGKRS